MGMVDPLKPASIYTTEPPRSLLKHSHTAIPLQAVAKVGILAVNNPAHVTVWMVNHWEFPPNSMSHIDAHAEGKGLGEGELLFDEVQVPGKGGGGKMSKGRDGPVVGLVVQQHQLGSKPRDDP